ncbi:proline dehydrogenase family protein [Macrococcoides bohemicum]|uniref:proline dehydrogenase n=1 Tax=Macrococcoides bohemicum TaxID=1903056 RepID=A0A328A692_9STAP|nr:MULTISPECIES: proline dehydrogenase family protein [Macrococcus]ATD29946.1 proline dehydrogenase [Macrococcus sp. IME1552]QRN50359.1 proline dehydrogenase family protein [Macrococcus bohemicus]RAK50032.1 proline dehydrogenase [Macrococcus bohemicus]TDL35539.1 proline dehydrogenase [Macrococcus bohemicus]
MGLSRDFFIALSENATLNEAAKKYGLALGANKVVAGTDVETTIESIRALNAQNISATVDNLGEFVFSKEEATAAKNNILTMIQALFDAGVDAHMSIKLTQIGLDVDPEFCYENLREILLKAHECGNMHINMDTEDYNHTVQTFEMLDRLKGEFKNVGTVIQAYLFRATEEIEKYKDVRLRLVKGAYKEDASVAYQSKEDIDANYIKIIEQRLLNAKAMTSIATHDHNIIDHVKKFIAQHNLNNDLIEFQMLYGFRSELQVEIANSGYNFCTYVPYGEDWYGYFMRRLAERPQNLQLVYKSIVTPQVERGAIVAGSALAGLVVLRKLLKK